MYIASLTVHSLVHEWPRADNDVIFDMVIHFIAIFNVDACAPHVPQDIVADSREMSPMDDDTSLVRLLDSVISELTVRARAELVKMKAILSLIYEYVDGVECSKYA